jgi:hypothetical protein
MKAVMLLTIDNPELAVNIENRSLSLKFLLICGIHADAQAMVVPTAFHMLDNILYGNEEYEIKQSETRRLVDESVEDVTSDGRCISALLEPLGRAGPLRRDISGGIW